MQPALLAGGDILIGSGSGLATNSGMSRVTVAHDPNGWNVKERWTSRGLKPYFNDFVVHEGHAYGFDGSLLASVDLADGARKWKGGRYGHGQLVVLTDQDLLLVLSEEGELALVKATPDGSRSWPASRRLEGKTWNHPVLVGDVLLVRNGEEMAAFRLSLAGSWNASSPSSDRSSCTFVARRCILGAQAFGLVGIAFAQWLMSRPCTKARCRFHDDALPHLRTGTSETRRCSQDTSVRKRRRPVAVATNRWQIPIEPGDRIACSVKAPDRSQTNFRAAKLGCRGRLGTCERPTWSATTMCPVAIRLSRMLCRRVPDDPKYRVRLQPDRVYVREVRDVRGAGCMPNLLERTIKRRVKRRADSELSWSRRWNKV